MMERPDDESVNPPWVVRDCECKGPVCDLCDGNKWYFLNTETAHTVSPLLYGASLRHG